MGFFLCFRRPFLLFESSDGDVNACSDSGHHVLHADKNLSK